MWVGAACVQRYKGRQSIWLSRGLPVVTAVVVGGALRG